MKKNWLIRTKNNHILGPVSKDKIKELIQKGSIKGDDEICSGNGYWFFIREQDLVAKYVFGDNIQDFNPVQEAAPSFQTKGSQVDDTQALKLPEDNDLEYPSLDNSGKGEDESTENRVPDDSKIPDDSDLEFPDIGNEKNDVTKVQVSLKDLKKETIESSDPIDNVIPLKKESESTQKVVSNTSKKQVTKKIKKKTKARSTIAEKESDDKKSGLTFPILIMIAVVFIIVAIMALKYRKVIITNLIETTFISNAQAQEIDIEFKKKNGSI